MVNFDKTNFSTHKHEKSQEIYDQCNDNMAISHATVVLPSTTVQDYLASITSLPMLSIMNNSSAVQDMQCSHPQALKTLYRSIPQKYLMTDQQMLNPLPPLPRIKEKMKDPPAVTKMICTIADCVAQGDYGANRALTNDTALLTKFTLIVPLPIGTIGPKPNMATH